MAPVVINPYDEVRLPHIRPNFTIDIFQFVQVITGDPCSVTSTERTGEKSSGLRNQSGGTVAH